MSQLKFAFFKQALKAGQRYVQTSVKARDSQYRFLALVYLAHREGRRHPKEFESLIQSRLKRQPNKHETKRPFLLLHALLGREDDLPRNAVKRFSKLTSALEEIDDRFRKADPTAEEIVAFIQIKGGILGLYDLKRNGDVGYEKRPEAKPFEPQPKIIELPLLSGAQAVRVGRSYRLRMPDSPPGVYWLRLHVGMDGFVHSAEKVEHGDAA
jgi:hypothetical protein